MTCVAEAQRDPDIFSPRILKSLKRPGGNDDDVLEAINGGLRCANTGDIYSYMEGVPSLYVPTACQGANVTSLVKSFYEAHPFPSYEGLEEFGELVTKGNKNPFSASLLGAIGFNKLVLECGCGTGQLTNFLQINNNHVLGVDISLASLRMAIEHKMRNRLVRSGFAQMNIYDLAVKDRAFDVVIAHGVLHHTFDARRAFSCLVRKVKAGGIIMVGLYSWYARALVRLRSKAIELIGPDLDYVVRNRIVDSRKADIWIKDQYYNPHETWHTIDEVLAWFDENDVEYLNCYPPILDTDGEGATSLFAKTDPGNIYQRVVTQLSWLGTIAREGAVFDVIGRRVN